MCCVLMVFLEYIRKLNKSKAHQIGQSMDANGYLYPQGMVLVLRIKAPDGSVLWEAVIDGNHRVVGCIEAGKTKLRVLVATPPPLGKYLSNF